jgi:hypothetical protein
MGYVNKTYLSTQFKNFADKIAKVFSKIGHTHLKSDITDFPTSMPANGGNAATVGGHTVGVNVPSNAKFTDTTYSKLSEFTDDVGYVKNTDARLTNARPASDVYAWAKASTKPTYTASEVGLGNVGNFKAVSTVANQGLSSTEKANARANIGAGTSSFSGSYNDLTNKPTIPTVGNGTVTIKQAGTNKGTFTMNQSGNTTIELTDNNTWRGIQNNLTSNSTTDSLSAAQGKVLKGLVDGKAASSHTHTKSQITDFPTSLPANGGNADTVDGHHFNWSGQGGQPTWIWGGNDSSNMYVYNPINFSVNYANRAGTVTGSYTNNGGQQNPNYFGVNKVGFLMMNTTVNGDNHYKDWIIMDCYSGSDVGGATAIGVDRQEMKAFIMGSDADRTSWTRSAELITTNNISSQSVNYANTAGSAPASDVYAWAKASKKPSYSWSEITSKPSTFTPASHTHTTATTSLNGFMSSSDKSKLDSIEEGATARTGALTIYMREKNSTVVSTFTGKVDQTISFNNWETGTTAGTVCAGNDARLSKIGTTDISSIGNGTVTGALSTLNSNLSEINKFTPKGAINNLVSDCLNITTDLKHFKSPDCSGYVASEGSNVYNSPVSGTFYAYREVKKIPNINQDGSSRHGCKIIVILYEAYPQPCRIWLNVYNTDTQSWSGWTEK